ncbi:MAG: hypothetical protein WBD20_17145 [Pirellulaceae bacterium]
MTAGCGGESDLIDTAKKKAVAAATTIKDAASESVVDMAGADPVATVTIDQPYEELACLMFLREMPDGRGWILQAMNYSNEEEAAGRETYLLHVPVDQPDLEQLDGKTIEGRFFFQSAGDVWYSANDQPVKVKVTTGVLEHTLDVSGTLTHVNDNTTQSISGTFIGRFE